MAQLKTLVKVSEHHAEFFEGLLSHPSGVLGLQLVLHVHTQLVELVPLLPQTPGAVIIVFVPNKPFSIAVPKSSIFLSWFHMV